MARGCRARVSHFSNDAGENVKTKGDANPEPDAWILMINSNGNGWIWLKFIGLLRLLKKRVRESM